MVSVGKLLLNLDQKYSKGLLTAYYRDHVRKRILGTPPIVKINSDICEIHILICKPDWLNAIWALRSFYYYSGTKYSLCIHDDGSLTGEQIQVLSAQFPMSRVINREEADEKLYALLRHYPRCLELRKTNKLSLKVFDFAAYLNADRMLLMDSDLLFFKKPDELIRRIEDQTYTLNSVNADIDDAYTVCPSLVKERLGIDLIHRFNSGLGLIHRASLRLDWIEEFLSLPDIVGHFWRIEQTLYALCSSRYGVELLPGQYEVFLNGKVGDRPCRHYVGVIRHLMYKEGIRLLVKDNFLKKLE